MIFALSILSHFGGPLYILMPAIIIYEVYKVLKREVSEEKALLAVGYMKKSQTIPFDDNLALAAADISLHKNLAMADAIIVATGQAYNCKIISQMWILKVKPMCTISPKTTFDDLLHFLFNWGLSPISNVALQDLTPTFPLTMEPGLARLYL